MDCPFKPSGKQTVKQVVTITDNDHHTYEMYDIEGGKENKTMTIKYTREK